jgi:8-oxo-dGTP pyrophosphatase MutT (NUDIX family)
MLPGISHGAEPPTVPKLHQVQPTRVPNPSDHAVAFDEARRIARVNAWREKSLIYVTRSPAELLVLEHTEEYPDAGVQVPAGGVDPGEGPDQTVERELAEETGLHIDSAPVYLESRVWRTAAPSRIRHYFWVVAPPGTPDRWSHTVSGGDEDQGMLFWLSFRPRLAHGLTPGYGWDAALDRLDRAIADTAR